MRIIYVRSTSERSAKEQIDAWRRAGYAVDNDRDPVYIEDQPPRKDRRLHPESLVKRQHAIDSIALHPGRAADIGVENLYILGLTEDDILDAMKAISDAGGAVYVLAEDRLISWHPDAIEVVRAIKDAGATLRRDRSAPGRRVAQIAGTSGS